MVTAGDVQKQIQQVRAEEQANLAAQAADAERLNQLSQSRREEEARKFAAKQNALTARRIALEQTLVQLQQAGAGASISEEQARRFQERIQEQERIETEASLREPKRRAELRAEFGQDFFELTKRQRAERQAQIQSQKAVVERFQVEQQMRKQLIEQQKIVQQAVEKAKVPVTDKEAELTFFEKGKKFGFLTTTLEAAGEKAKQIQLKQEQPVAIEDIKPFQLRGTISPEKPIFNLIPKEKQEEIIKQKTILTAEAAKSTIKTAPFFIPTVGAGLLAVSGAEQLATPGGREGIQETSLALQEKGLSQPVAQTIAFGIPIAQVVIGTAVIAKSIKGAVVARQEAQALQAAQKKVTIVSGTSKQKAIKQVLSRIDDQIDISQLQKGKKLTGTRVYKTKITLPSGEKRTLKFVEFAKGFEAPVKGGGTKFVGARKLYGVETLGKRVTNYYEGVTIEKGKGAVTKVLQTGERNQLFTFIEKTQKVTTQKAGTLLKVESKGKISSFVQKQKPLQFTDDIVQKFGKPQVSFKGTFTTKTLKIPTKVKGSVTIARGSTTEGVRQVVTTKGVELGEGIIKITPPPAKTPFITFISPKGLKPPKPEVKGVVEKGLGKLIEKATGGADVLVSKVLPKTAKVGADSISITKPSIFAAIAQERTTQLTPVFFTGIKGGISSVPTSQTLVIGGLGGISGIELETPSPIVSDDFKITFIEQQKQKPTITVDITPKVSTEIISGTKTGLTQPQLLLQQPRLEQIQLPKQIQQPLQTPQQIQAQPQQQLQLQRQQQLQLQKQLQIQRQLDFFQPQRPVRTPKIIIFPLFGGGGVIPKPKPKGRPKQAFEVQVRRSGQFRTISKRPLPKGLALRLGARRTISTLAATFRLRPKGFTTRKDIRFTPGRRTFRRPKSGEKLTFVERKPLRLKKGSPEIMEILEVRAKKPRKRRKKR